MSGDPIRIKDPVGVRQHRFTVVITDNLIPVSESIEEPLHRLNTGAQRAANADCLQAHAAKAALYPPETGALVQALPSAATRDALLSGQIPEGKDMFALDVHCAPMVVPGRAASRRLHE